MEQEINSRFSVRLQAAETVQVLSGDVYIAWKYYTSKKATLFVAFAIYSIDSFAILVPFSMTAEK